MTDGNDTLRVYAIEAAGLLKDKESFKGILLYKLKYDKNWKVMVSAAKVLYKLKVDKAIDVIVTKFANSYDAKVLAPLLEIIRKAKVYKAAKMLRMKQKRLHFSFIKSRIKKVLEEWAVSKPKGKKKTVITKVKKKKKTLHHKKTKKKIRVFLK